VIAKLPDAAINHPTAHGVSKLTAANCETLLQQFKD
jgi:hypothetical protein